MLILRHKKIIKFEFSLKDYQKVTLRHSRVNNKNYNTCFTYVISSAKKNHERNYDYFVANKRIDARNYGTQKKSIEK